MRYSLLGRTGMRVSKIALGTATFGVAPEPGEAQRLVDAAIDNGVNLFDCANSYGNQARFDRPGSPPADRRASAEEILGRALHGRRHKAVLCSKACERVGDDVNDEGLSRRHLFAQVEASLKRLGTDHIDVYHAHHPDPDTPVEETVRAFDDLIRQGKIRHYALSTYPAWRLTEVLWRAERLGASAPVCHQVPYNLSFRLIEREVRPACEAFGVSITAFGPLGGGVFAGGDAISRDFSGHRRWGGPSFSERQIEAGRQLQELADESGTPVPHLAIAWLLARPAVAAAIVGPETTAELLSNVGAGDLELGDDLLAAVDAVGRDPGSTIQLP